MRGFLPLSGTLTVQIISAEPAKVLEAIVNAGITVSGITSKSELSYEFRISHKAQCIRLSITYPCEIFLQ